MFKLLDKLNLFLKKQNVSVDFIVPIARGANIMATYFSYRLLVREMYPIQTRLIPSKNGKTIECILNSLSLIKNKKECANILLIENLHNTGETYKKVYSEIKKAFPNASILYISFFREKTQINIDNLLYNDFAIQIENIDEVKNSGKKLPTFFVCPWEVTEDELKQLV